MELVLPDFGSGAVWLALLTLTFLEIVLGIDNIIFISIASSRLEAREQRRAIHIGLLLAMALRIALLFGISILIAMNTPWLSFDWGWAHGDFSGQSLMLIAGGVFLLYKSTTEIHHKLEGEPVPASMSKKAVRVTFGRVVVQITLINLVFSFDAILTAVGMTSGLEGALLLMIVAVVVSVLVMMLFAAPVGRFVNRHPTVQMLGLAFLLLIGFMLVAEGAHMAHLTVFGAEVGVVPKGYLYFAIVFSLFVEFLNLRLRKRKAAPVHLHSVTEDAARAGVI